MKCDYKDDFRVEYAGSLHITKGDGVDVIVSGAQIPAGARASLDSAVSHNSCHELRSAARSVTDTIAKAFDVE